MYVLYKSTFFFLEVLVCFVINLSFFREKIWGKDLFSYCEEWLFYRGLCTVSYTKKIYHVAVSCPYFLLQLESLKMKYLLSLK